MRLSLVVHVIGLVTRPFGLMFLAPLAVCLIYAEYADALGFAILTAITCVTGHAMRLAGGRDAEDSPSSLAPGSLSPGLRVCPTCGTA